MPWVTRMGPAGLAMELNPDDYADVYATFYDQFKPPFEPLMNEGKTIGVATRWGWVGGCVNTDITNPDEWKYLRSGVRCQEQGQDLRHGLGRLADPAHGAPCRHRSLSGTGCRALEEVRKVLRAMFKNTRTLVADLTQAQKGLLDGSLLGCIGAGSYLTSAVRKQGHKNIMATVPDPKNG
jgi:spermidine/putrescine transport system substrate-binding protein